MRVASPGLERGEDVQLGMQDVSVPLVGAGFVRFERLVLSLTRATLESTCSIGILIGG